MRKDVECTFGILKGRFRILKSGIRLHSIDSTDAIWKTCCSLHNWLREIDGLNMEYPNQIRSDWLGELGNHEFNDVIQFVPNFANYRLNNPVEVRSYDTSGIGNGTDIDENMLFDQNANESRQLNILTDEECSSEEGDSFTYVRRMDHEKFREKLVIHFDILFQRNQIQWPIRN